MVVRLATESATSAPSMRTRANGPGDLARPVERSSKAARPRDVRQARMGQSLSQVVAVLMRDTNFRHMRLADLEWLVLPAIMSGQFRLCHATRHASRDQEQSGISVPVAVVLWARVSPAIDKALCENLDKPVRLAPNQWASGNIPWLIAAAGDPCAVPTLLKQLAEQEFKGQEMKLRARGPAASALVKTLTSYLDVLVDAGPESVARAGALDDSDI